MACLPGFQPDFTAGGINPNEGMSSSAIAARRRLRRMVVPPATSRDRPPSWVSTFRPFREPHDDSNGTG